jgi:hypothetical protein
MIKLLKISPSDKATKKYDAIFNVDGKRRTVSFGAKGYSDFIHHKNEARKNAYLSRHKTTENWNNPITPGSLSRWILWNKPTLKESVSDYVRRFNL